jgi:biopolymer transport protein ExbB/TolQ
MRTNRLLRAGIGFALVAVAAWLLGFLVTVVSMTQSFNAISDSPSAVVPDQVTRAVGFAFDATAISLAVAVPAGALALVLIVAGFIRGRRDRRQSESDKKRGRESSS